MVRLKRCFIAVGVYLGGYLLLSFKSPPKYNWFLTLKKNYGLIHEEERKKSWRPSPLLQLLSGFLFESGAPLRNPERGPETMPLGESPGNSLSVCSALATSRIFANLL